MHARRWRSATLARRLRTGRGRLEGPRAPLKKARAHFVVGAALCSSPGACSAAVRPVSTSMALWSTGRAAREQGRAQPQDRPKAAAHERGLLSPWLTVHRYPGEPAAHPGRLRAAPIAGARGAGPRASSCPFCEVTSIGDTAECTCKPSGAAAQGPPHARSTLTSRLTNSGFMCLQTMARAVGAQAGGANDWYQQQPPIRRRRHARSVRGATAARGGPSIPLPSSPSHRQTAGRLRCSSPALRCSPRQAHTVPGLLTSTQACCSSLSKAGSAAQACCREVPR